MKKRWARFTNPEREQLRAWLESDEAGELRFSQLHLVAQQALFGYRGQLRDPFPRIESHGHYVFGMLAAPTSVHDADTEFCVLHFVADVDEIVTVLRSSRNFDIRPIEEKLSQLEDLANDETTSTGFIFARVAEVFMDQIEKSTEALKARVFSDIEGVTKARSTVGALGDTAHLVQLHSQAVANQTEVLGLKTLVEETKNLLTAITSDSVDVRRSGAEKTEDLFPQFVEVAITDLLMRARHQKAIQANLQDELDAVFEHHQELQSLRQTAAAKRFTGMLSILLFPQLIVAFFGQSFRQAPLYENQYGWLISLCLVGIVSVAQFIWFKRKQWL